jgi:hypothetical protein
MNWRELLREAISENPLTKAHAQAISSQTQPTNAGATINAGSPPRGNHESSRNAAPGAGPSARYVMGKMESRGAQHPIPAIRK